jgi:hypothetical protein
LALVASVHCGLQRWVLPVMRRAHQDPWIYDGRLLNRHAWRLSLPAAPTARTSMGVKEVLASAGSGRSCCLLRWRPTTAVSTGLHLRFGSSATIAPLRDPLPLRPDPLQGFAELSLTQWSCQVAPSQSAADPPHLKTPKDQGEQTQLEVSSIQVVQDFLGRLSPLYAMSFPTS